MKLFKKNITHLFLLGLIFAFASCESNEVTKITLSKSSLSLKVGQSDSVQSVITFSGDLDGFPVSWSIENPDLISLEELNTELNSNGNKSDLSKNIVVTALKAGTTKLTIKVGEKSMSCDVTVTQTSFAFNQAFTSNWGDYYELGTNNFDMYLLENTLSVSSEGDLVGSGNYLYLEFNVPITQNGINDGNYILSTTGAVNTFFPGETGESNGETFIVGSRVVSKSGTTSTVKLITDGSFSITTVGAQYLVEGDLITEDKEIFHFKYEGALDVADNREEPVDLSPNFTHGRLYYFGDAYNSKTTNNFVAYLATETVNFDSTELKGEILMLEFNTALTVTDSIPSGTYNMMAQLDYASLIPYSLVLGYTTENGSEYGTWYYGETAKKLINGNVNVNKVGNIYTLNYELYDRIGSKIGGTYTGTLEYIDGTATTSSVSAQRVKRSNQTKIFPMKQTKTKRIKVSKM